MLHKAEGVSRCYCGGLILNHQRRELLKLSASVLAVTILPMPGLAATLNNSAPRRRLSLFNTHTGESIDTCYFNSGVYCPDALNQINYILRDHRTKEVQPIDLHLLDTLNAINIKVRPKTPFHIISGYRSPATNAMLRKTTTGVARKSFHIKGKAIDIRLPGYNSRRLRDLCMTLKSGGVGYYKDSNFVHLDTGPVRAW